MTQTKKTTTRKNGNTNSFLGAGYEQRAEIFSRLSEPFKESEVEKTFGTQTYKGYDTVGIKYDFLVMRLNQVLGLGGWRMTSEMEETEGGSGKKMFVFQCSLIVELLREDTDGTMTPFASAVAPGGHASKTPWDAKKGAITNAFKRAVREFGMGAHEHWRNEVDDDHSLPADAHDNLAQGKEVKKAKAVQKARAPARPRAKPTVKGKGDDRRNQVKVGTDIDNALEHLERFAGSHWPRVKFEMETEMGTQLRELNRAPRDGHDKIVARLRTWVPRIKAMVAKWNKEDNGASKVAERVVMKAKDEGLEEMPPPDSMDEEPVDPNLYGE